MHVVIFEGSRWPTFAPLSLNRPVFLLRSGMHTLLEKQIRYLKPSRLTLWVRPGLVDYCRKHLAPSLPIPTRINEPLDDEPALLASGRTLYSGAYQYPPHHAALLDEHNVISSALIHSPGLSPEDSMRRSDPWMKIRELPHMLPQGRMASYMWDLIGWNEDSFLDDVAHLPDDWETSGERFNPAAPSDPPRAPAGTVKRPHPSGPYHMVSEQNIRIAASAKLQPGCVLDAANGPVIIAANAIIGANAVIQGPCYIGPSTQVAPLAVIRRGVTTGPNCRLGGEVSNSIFQGFSNKIHDGFLGDSFIGEWVNLGASTVTSNLKNTYGEIRVPVGPQIINTGRIFLGAVIGDHSKTSIGTHLMAGTYIGYCAMVACSAYAPRFVPSFSFMTDSGTQPYELDKARHVMRAVYTRRGREWDDGDEATLRYAAETAGAVEGAQLAQFKNDSQEQPAASSAARGSRRKSDASRASPQSRRRGEPSV